ncbi:FUSC family protein [Pararhizobium mangrovi]|uniref:FUSC family protein n=1 Tax=Pararhizobium mangrovi TaxID=2590452 RepID=A0A506U5A8_9HYPH|nr:FUSC family protein [Pararhizobium mangrovi]TPW28145.1 FUSC family protein [Pararhizobium mangrovi]
MQRPAPWQILFALKAFAAAMLALYIAFSLDLTRPYWALTTVYVVSQPFAGAIRSKGVFRIGGTIAGASAGIAMTAIFGAWQPGLIAGLACWVYACGYLALSDRSPRGYFFLLAALTGLLVAWPGSSLSSGPIFPTAVARVEEIGLGILCAVFVDSVFFPRRIAPVIDTQLRTWFDDARQWSLDVLSGKREKADADRAKLAADAAQIAPMTVHLDYEMADEPQRARWIRVLQRRMLFILPVLSSIDDRLSQLRAGKDGLPSRLDAIVADLQVWIEAKAPAEEGRRLEERLAAFSPKDVATSRWNRVLLVSLCERLADFVRIVGDCRELSALAGDPRKAPSARVAEIARNTSSEPHRDHGMIVWAIATSMLSFSVAAAFWYFTGWSGGATAAMFSLLMSLFFGSMDNPMPMLKLLFKVLLFAVALDSLYLFVIMPSTHSFPTLVIALAPALIPLGIVASNPATFIIALMPIAMMTMRSTAFIGFAPFLNGMIGMIFGVVIVLLVSGVVKAVSAETSVRRVVHAGWRDLERIASARGTREERHRFVARMLDRLALLAPRLAALSAESGLVANDALSETRLGLALIELQHHRRHLAAGGQAAVGAVLSGVASHYRDRRRNPHCLPHATLLEALDQALGEVLDGPEGEHRRPAVLALAGVRRALFQGAPPAMPEERPDEPEAREPDVAPPLVVAAE